MRQSRIPNHGVVASYNPNLAGLEKTMAYINPLGLTYQFDFWGKNQAALDAALGQAAAQQAQARRSPTSPHNLAVARVFPYPRPVAAG